MGLITSLVGEKQDKPQTNAFGVPMAEPATKQKLLAEDSILNELDVDGDGVITNEELEQAIQIQEFDHKRKMQENEDKKEDQIRAMAWFAPWGMLLYPVLILITSLFQQETAAKLISDIAPTYFVAIAGLVAAFFGAQAYSKKSNGDTPPKKK